MKKINPILNSSTIKSYGDRLEMGIYEIHSRFDKAVNFYNKNFLVSVVNEKIGSGPLNIVVNNLNLKNVNSLGIDENSIFLNESKFEFDVSKRYVSKIECDNVNQERMAINLDLLKVCLVECSSPKSLAFLLDDTGKKNFKTSFEKELVKRFESGVTRIFSSDPIAGIKMITGAGFGFTPSGDDFICGLLIALNVAQKLYKLDLKKRINEIYSVTLSKNSISNAFLLCAKQGLMFERFKDLVLSIMYLGKKEIFESTQSLISVGETSGADIAVGFLMGLKNIIILSVE